MAIRKNDLDNSLYSLCDELRGGMDPSQYKDYVLTLVFVKYISDRYAGVKYAPVTIPEGCSFEDFKQLRNNPRIGEQIDIALAKLAENNQMLAGMFKDVHFNDETKIGKGDEMVDKLTRLINIFCRSEFDFSRNKASGDDILGDVYENLMRHFAVDSGKSKGQFYTPAEASRVVAGILGISEITEREEGWSIYDAACGSGSLLIRSANEAPCQVAIYGQEENQTTAGLAKMNMVLHNLPTAEIKVGNTFSSPQFTHIEDGEEVLDKFDFAVLNPPFSLKNWKSGYKDFGRTDGYGAMPPEKNGDYAWVMHVLKSLKREGRAAIILPLGVLSRGNAEETIRKTLIDKGIVEGVIAFPSNIFFGTGIAACVMVLAKSGAEEREGVFMIDAARDFIKDGNKNRLRERDVEKIVSAYRSRREETHYSRFVKWDEIKEKNGYNLSMSRYIDSGVREDVQDVEAHLKGGIPSADIEALSIYWDSLPNMRQALFKPLRKGYEALVVEPPQVRETIHAEAAFAMYSDRVDNAFKAWAREETPVFSDIDAYTDAKHFIAEPARVLMERFSSLKLFDPYDVYEVLLKYWTDTMNDDLHLVVANGWEAGREIETFYKETENKKTKQIKKVETGWDGLLIPRKLIDARFFKAESEAVAKAEAALEAAKAELEDLAASGEAQDEYSQGSEEEVLRFAACGEDPVRLRACAEEKRKAASKALKAAQKKLETLEKAKYPTLSIDEIKELVVADKWIATVHSGIDELFRSISVALTERVDELARRYARPLGEIASETAVLEKSVAKRLAAMGY